MTRSSFRPMASVGLVAAVLVYVGCAKTRETEDRSAAKAAENPSTPEKILASATQPNTDGTKGERIPKLFADWSENPPTGILLISGEQDGYPDPCGCTDGQLGGLGRRYDFLEKLQAKGWPVAKVDLGNLIHFRGDSRGGRTQEKIKFEIILQALEAMKYDAVALGPEDLKLGVLDTITTLLNHPEPKYLAANVKPTDEGLAAAIQPIKIAKAGPLTIGITAVLDPASYDELQDTDKALLTVKPADEALPAVIEELKKQSRVRVLMVQGPFEEAKRLAEKFPIFDIVIGTSEYPDPDARPETVNDGNTMLIRNIGKKGKHVGVIGFFPNSKTKMQFYRQSLDGRDFHQAEPMRKLIDEEYQDRLKREGVVENFTRFPNGKAPAGAEYVGAQACQACHPKTFEKWTTTKHAKAFDALTNPKRYRVFDAECISCHTTGFGYKTGWVSAEQTPLLKGNQCENCHGPASLHVAQPTNPAFSKPMAMSAEVANATNFCTKCHDEDNDHNFKFETHYPQIFHKGFDNPKAEMLKQAKPAGVPK